ncbi:MAG: Hsp20/alpha crystallin family protein [Chloroflexota bacterium]|nr:MAG: Hsp20/alpha crystallin family protein [Chloroflexota bacterium]
MARDKDSFEEFVGFSSIMDRMMSSLMLQDNGQLPSLWRPPTDVYETQENVVILIEVAGMDSDKIQVEFGDKILRVSGRRSDQHLRAACHCLEVQYGDFASEVYLPGQYDVDAIDAEYKDGFLTITLPKVTQETKLIKAQTTDQNVQRIK